MDVELVGASIKRENIISGTPSTTDLNYYLGHCPNGILTEGKLYCYNRQTGAEVPSAYKMTTVVAKVVGNRDPAFTLADSYPCTEISFELGT